MKKENRGMSKDTTTISNKNNTLYHYVIDDKFYSFGFIRQEEPLVVSGTLVPFDICYADCTFIISTYNGKIYNSSSIPKSESVEMTASKITELGFVVEFDKVAIEIPFSYVFSTSLEGILMKDRRSKERKK